MTGDISKAHEAGKNGAISGLSIGTITGAGAGYKYAKDHDLNLWSGKWNGKISSNSEFRVTPASLEEQLVMQEAISGNNAKQIMKGQINDPNWKSWNKMEYTHKSTGYEYRMVNNKLLYLPVERTITIHYWSNPRTGETSGFKFK